MCYEPTAAQYDSSDEPYYLRHGDLANDWYFNLFLKHTVLPRPQPLQLEVLKDNRGAPDAWTHDYKGENELDFVKEEIE